MNTRPFYFGLIFIAIIAILANYLGNTDFSHHYHISALIIAILLGMAIGNTIYPQFSTQVEKGVLFAKGTLLRTGIVLYGFRLTFGDIADVGLNAVVTDAIMLISTFFFTALLGIRYLKMDKQLVYLTGAGCSICGAARRWHSSYSPFGPAIGCSCIGGATHSFGIFLLSDNSPIGITDIQGCPFTLQLKANLRLCILTMMVEPECGKSFCRNHPHRLFKGPFLQVRCIVTDETTAQIDG